MHPALQSGSMFTAYFGPRGPEIVADLQATLVRSLSESQWKSLLGISLLLDAISAHLEVLSSVHVYCSLARPVLDSVALFRFCVCPSLGIDSGPPRSPATITSKDVVLQPSPSPSLDWITPADVKRLVLSALFGRDARIGYIWRDATPPCCNHGAVYSSAAPTVPESSALLTRGAADVANAAVCRGSICCLDDLPTCVFSRIATVTKDGSFTCLDGVCRFISQLVPSHDPRDDHPPTGLPLGYAAGDANPMRPPPREAAGDFRAWAQPHHRGSSVLVPLPCLGPSQPLQDAASVPSSKRRCLPINENDYSSSEEQSESTACHFFIQALRSILLYHRLRFPHIALDFDCFGTAIALFSGEVLCPSPRLLASRDRLSLAAHCVACLSRGDTLHSCSANHTVPVDMTLRAIPSSELASANAPASTPASAVLCSTVCVCSELHSDGNFEADLAAALNANTETAPTFCGSCGVSSLRPVLLRCCLSYCGMPLGSFLGGGTRSLSRSFGHLGVEPSGPTHLDSAPASSSHEALQALQAEIRRCIYSEILDVLRPFVVFEHVVLQSSNGDSHLTEPFTDELAGGMQQCDDDSESICFFATAPCSCEQEAVTSNSFPCVDLTASGGIPLALPIGYDPNGLDCMGANVETFDGNLGVYHGVVTHDTVASVQSLMEVVLVVSLNTRGIPPLYLSDVSDSFFASLREAVQHSVSRCLLPIVAQHVSSGQIIDLDYIDVYGVDDGADEIQSPQGGAKQSTEDSHTVSLHDTVKSSIARCFASLVCADVDRARPISSFAQSLYSVVFESVAHSSPFLEFASFSPGHREHVLCTSSCVSRD